MRNALNKMKSLDLFVNSLSNDEYKSIKQDLNQTVDSNLNIMSLDFHLENFNSILNKVTFKQDVDYLLRLSEKHFWNTNINNILNQNDFEALVLTDASKNILWVNDGFTSMTGYSKKYAINKTPTFLQTNDTSAESRKKIREKLLTNKPFKEVIINKRKDATLYKCELHIFPLQSGNSITHFLALEREVA